MRSLVVTFPSDRLAIKHVWRSCAFAVLRDVTRMLACTEVVLLKADASISHRERLALQHQIGVRVISSSTVNDGANLVREYFYQNKSASGSIHYIAFASQSDQLQFASDFKALHKSVHFHLFLDRVGEVEQRYADTFESIIFPSSNRSPGTAFFHTCNQLARIVLWSGNIRRKLFNVPKDTCHFTRRLDGVRDRNSFLYCLALTLASDIGPICFPKSQAGRASSPDAIRPGLNIEKRSGIIGFRDNHEADERWLVAIDRMNELGDGLRQLLGNPPSSHISVRSILENHSALRSYVHERVSWWDPDEEPVFTISALFGALSNCSDWLGLDSFDKFLLALSEYRSTTQLDVADLSLCFEILEDAREVNKPLDHRSALGCGLKKVEERFVRKAILFALQEVDGNKSKARALLGYEKISGFQNRVKSHFPGLAGTLLKVLIGDFKIRAPTSSKGKSKERCLLYHTK